MRLLLLARRNPSALLLIVQLIGLLLYPALEGRTWGRLFLEVFSIIVLALAVFLVRDTPGLAWVSVTLGLPAVVLSFVATVTGTLALDAYSAPLYALFYFYAAYSLLRYTLADSTVTSDELFATGATFTLVAWGFANTFQFVQAVSHGAFISAQNPQDPRTWMELLYLSFTTLTSTGLSDVMPITAWARSAVMFEQLAGIAFLGMVVARLVALTVTRSRRDSDATTDAVAGATEDSDDSDAAGVVAGPTSSAAAPSGDPAGDARAGSVGDRS